MIFQTLPSTVSIVILSEWFLNDCLTRLDSASCNKNYRELIMFLICNSRRVASDQRIKYALLKSNLLLAAPWSNQDYFDAIEKLKKLPQINCDLDLDAKCQSQRLLLLHHASKCPHECGRCIITPHCWGMRVLWHHVLVCKVQDCQIPHLSSRYMLSHYSRCANSGCSTCGPLREAIKLNYLRYKKLYDENK